MSSYKRPTSGRPSVTPRKGSLSQRQNEEFDSECQAAYLVVFDDLDDEITTKDELNRVLQQAGRNPSRKTLQKYWKGTDLTFNDFCNICAKEPATSEDELMKAFKKIDLNGDGYLSNSELRKVLTTKGERMTAAEVAAIIDEVDENKDGVLDYREFCTFVMKTQEEAKQFALKNMKRKGGQTKKSLKTDNLKIIDSRGLAKKYHERIKEDSDDKESQSDNSIEEEEEDMNGSQTSLKFKSSSRSDQTKAAITSKEHKLQRPRNIRDWQKKSSKGCFFFEDDGRIVSHQYTIELPKDTSVWITVEPLRDSHGTPVDTMAFLLTESDSLVTFTEHRDNKGKYGVRCDLERGVYKLIPFTTGCRFKRRTRESETEAKLVKKKDGSFVLTPAFKEALSEVFDLCDLDGDGLMNRDEFNWFNVRTSGEEVNDEEWKVVEDTVDLERGKLTKAGFIHLNQMEAEDNQGDTDDLWVTLSSMGFNKELKVDEACLFNVEVYAEETSVKLKVNGLKSGGRKLETAIVESTMGKGEATKVKHSKDLLLHTYSNDFRACVVVENKASSKVTLDLDCTRSKNAVSNRKSLEHKMDVPPKSVMVGFHLMPKKESQDWSMVVNESIIT